MCPTCATRGCAPRTAYPGCEGARDVGGGSSMLDWLEEIDAFIDGKAENAQADARIGD